MGRRAPAALLTLLFACQEAQAANCSPSTHESTCFDADQLWVPATPSEFVGIAPSHALEEHQWVFGFDASFASRPVILTATSPDPFGREVQVVDDVVDATLSAAYSPRRHLELTAALPFSLYRAGTGLSGVTSSTGPGLSPLALRDLRIGVAHDLVLSRNRRDADGFSATSRLELALPTGASSSFAGTGTVTVAPSFSLGYRVGRALFGLQQGARFSRLTDFGGTHFGAELVSLIGASADAIDRGRLTIAVEAWLFPILFSQSRGDGIMVTHALELPAEWMASVGTRVDDVTLKLGAGGGIPWSGVDERALDGTVTSQSFAAVTTPSVRVTAVVRYVPGTAAR